jgi:CO/xanthine dehydrogenase FAD-binding subunit
MKPPAFDYLVPETQQELVELLARHAESAKILAGGQSLVPMLNLRLLRPACLIDINRVAGISYIVERNGEIAIGALTRQRELERSALIREKLPLVSEALPFIAHFQIRNRGTIGGSLSHADPAAELPALITALGGRMVIRSTREERTVPAAEFFTGYMTTVLQPDEVLAEVVIPIPPAGCGSAFCEVSRRHGDFALAAAAAQVTLDSQGRCRDAMLVLAGVHGIPYRKKECETILVGTRLEPADIAFACNLCIEGLEPHSDLHASAQYRKHAARVLAERALAKAAARARGRADGSR